MAKVIGYDESVKLRCTCRGCGAIIEYTPNEVLNAKVSCMGDVDTIYYIVCPSCGKDVNHVDRFRKGC